ncbi:MAG: hypothetical protein MPJ22_00280 [Pirellulales bacterium]|nr:hypothetical protein [Pirellulales bacterium]
MISRLFLSLNRGGRRTIGMVSAELINGAIGFIAIMFMSLAAIIATVLIVQFVNNTSRNMTVSNAASTGSVEVSSSTARNQSN